MKIRCFFGGKGKAKESIALSKIGQTLSKLWLIFDNEEKYIKFNCLTIKHLNIFDSRWAKSDRRKFLLFSFMYLKIIVILKKIINEQREATLLIPFRWEETTTTLIQTKGGIIVALQWLYSGSTTNKRRTMNEGITNLSRRKVEAKAEIKRRLLVDFNFAKDLKLWQSLHI